MTTAVRIRAAGASDPGRVRTNNEDRFHVDAQRGIFFVIDGVGGHAAGEVAADIAHRVLRSRLERRTGTPEERVREAIALANREILQEAEGSTERAGMACVLTVALVENDSVTVGHVGDTRLYELREARLRQVTHDHSPVGAMEAEGRLTEAEAMRHPRRNEVYRAVGSVPHGPDDPEFIETHQLALTADAALLLCTDGLTDQVPARPILELVRGGADDPEGTANRLIRAANNAGGKDNVTVVVLFGEQFPGRQPVTDPRPGPGPGNAAAGSARSSGAVGEGDSGAHARRVLAKPGVIAPLAFALGFTSAVLLFYFVFFFPRPEPQAPPPAADGSRTLLVGRAGAQFPTIAAALASARPGDVVEVGPGVYREEIALRDGVALLSRPRRGAILEPAGDAPEPRIAVTAVSVRAARLAGFVIRSAPGRPLAVGVHLRDAAAELEDLDISGATRAAVDISGAGEPVLRACDLHDNPGTGIVVRDDARPLIAHTIVRRNGGGPINRPGIDIQGGARPVLSGNVLAENGAEDVWMPAPGDPGILERNVFVPGRGTSGRSPIRLMRADGAPVHPVER